MIPFKQLDGTEIDLSVSKLFEEHYNKPTSFTKYIIDNEINKGLWDPEILRDILKKDAIVIDAGANVGLFSLYVLPYIRKIYLIEPTKSFSPIQSDVLLHFTSVEKIALCWNVLTGSTIGQIGEGVWSDTKYCLFQENTTNSTENKISNTGYRVPCTDLRKFINNRSEYDEIDLLKLDIEGAEQQVILEDSTVGEALKKCKNVYIELHQGIDPPSIDKKFLSEGFKKIEVKEFFKLL
jgi:FkbM family methyltransferase